MFNATPVPMHRDFDEDAPELPKEGPTFELGGETFHCSPHPPGEVLPRLASAVVIDQRGRQTYNLPDLNVFIEDCLVRERVIEVPADVAEGEPPRVEEVTEDCDDVQRWQALMSDHRRPVTVETLGNIAMWLSSVYSNRPTKAPRR